MVKSWVLISIVDFFFIYKIKTKVKLNNLCGTMLHEVIRTIVGIVGLKVFPILVIS